MKLNRSYAQWIVGLLLLCLTLSSFNTVILMADYWRNTEAYEAKCVNKYRPQLKCHGKCQLMLKMKDQEKKENTVTFKFVVVLSTKSFFTTTAPSLILLEPTKPSFPYNQLFSSLSFHSIFHPPQLA